jgi:hypothetical protein
VLRVTVALSCVFFPACDGSGDASSSTTGAGTGGAAVSSGTSGTSVTETVGATGTGGGAAGIQGSGTIHEYVPGANMPGPALAGVSICVHLPAQGACATTGNDGSFTMKLPASTDIGFLVQKAGYMRTLTLTRTPGTDFSGATLLLDSDATVQAYVEASGGTWPMTDKGAIVIGIDSGAGGTFALSGGTSGIGPVYASDAGTADPALTATTTAAYAKFVDVMPGTADITVSFPGKTCVGSMHPWSSMPGTMSVPVEAATLTQTGAMCQ